MAVIVSRIRMKQFTPLLIKKWYTWLISAIFFLAGFFFFDLFFQFILILGRIDFPEILGPYIAIGMLGLLYAFAFVLLLLPMESRLQIKLQNMLQD